MHIPSTQHQSELLLARTRAAYHLEYVLSISLDFSGVRDVSETVDFATKARILTGPQLINIATTLYSARQIRRQIDSAAQPCPAKLDPLSQLVSSFRTWPDVEQQITNHLDDYGQVQESADPELRGIRRSIQDTTAEIRAKLNDLMSKHTDAIQNRIITSRYDRYVIPVKVTHKAVFRRGIVHDMSSTGSTVYVEPMSIKSMNDRLRQLTAQEKARVNAILKKLTLTFVAPIADDVKHLQTLLGELDAAVARARCSRSLDACDVVFDNDRPLSLLGARHPLLAWRAIADSKSHKSGKPDDTANYSSTNSQLHPESEWKRHVVPTDYVLSEDIRCVCITGPNTGGKTLSLKTLGVCALMAKTGLFVPCTPPTLTEALPLMNRNQAAKDEACAVTRIPFFDTVLADIGDDQSLVQSLSTFSGHVRRIKRILAAATPQTLVLLDEIGSGTDPAEGAALGMAVLRHLTLGQRAALTFATTHHGELKTMKYIADDSARFFENASVEFDDVKMAPTYKLVWGVPGRSNALAIAERLGMDYDVIEEARFLLTGTSESDDGSKRVDIEKMISSLERDKIAADSAREESERTLQKIDAMKVELEERLERLRQSESNLRKEQRQVMDAELQQARKQIAKVIKDMQQGGGSAQGAAKASEKLRTMVVPGSTPNSSSQGENQASPIENANELNAGDRVIVSRLGANEVEVVDVVSKKEVLVALGAMKVKVKVKEIAKVNNLTASRSEVRESRAAPQQELGRQQLSVRTAANTVDVRGDRVNGAEAKVDRALDKALAIGSLWVIHGHGTGRLRRGIRNFLLSHPHVERIEDAEQSDGGTGVTVAYLS